MRRAERPIGYMFTDIDGSTERWERAPVAMKRAMARHNKIVDEFIQNHGGVIRDRAGDGVFAVFEGGQPLACALDIQEAMRRQDWRRVGGLSLRIGVHAGRRPLDQVAINRAARIAACAWGGQVVVSAEAVETFQAPDGARLDDLGFCTLRGIDTPLRLFSLGDGRQLSGDFPPPRGLVTQNKAALSAEPFFGRETEIAQIRATLRTPEVRLVSLVGPGGNGKTRLAERVAAEMGDKDPVWFVSLEGVSDEAAAISRIARSLQLPLRDGWARERLLIDFLGDKRALFVLDNAEGLGAAASVISKLIAACPKVRILATSRKPLGIAGECVVPVKGLASVGEAQSPAYRLFAHYAGADSVGSETELEAFRQLNALLDGSPLGLRLAAQWRRMLTTEEIAERVRSSLDFLRSAGPGIADRHGNLKSVFDATWASLDDVAQSALARLSVFVGGFDALAAAKAAGVSLSMLVALESHGVIERRGPERFTLHPVVRRCAAEKISRADAKIVRARHADHYLARLRRDFLDAPHVAQRAFLDWAEREAENLAAAWRFMLTHGPKHLLMRTAEALFYALVLRARYGEALALFDPNASEAMQSYCLSVAANCDIQLGEMERAEAAANSALKGDAPAAARAHALQALGMAAHGRGDFGAAEQRYRAALAIRRRRRDSLGCYYSCAALGVLLSAQGRLAEARAYIKQCQRLCLASGNESGLLITHFLAGEVAVQEGRWADALHNYERSLAIEDAIRHPQHRARTLLRLGSLWAERGELQKAISLHQQAHELSVQIGDKYRAAHALMELGVDQRLNAQIDQSRTRLVEAVRLALKLKARPLLGRTLFELARVEAAAGAAPRAAQLCSILAQAELGPLQSVFDDFVRELPAPGPADDVATLEAAALQVVEEADLAPLRL
jgi:predicted ATPase